jgi:flagellar protein FliO/FliZ
MRACTAATAAWLTLLPGIVAGQQAPGGSLVAPSLTPIAIEEPRTFPPAAALEARPLNPRYIAPSDVRHLPPGRPRPPVDVRLVAAEEPVARAAKAPLRLAPRSEASLAISTGSPRPAPASPTTALTTVAGSLTAVLGLFVIVAWCGRRFAPPGTRLLPKEAVELLGRAPLASRQQMQLVRIGNKLLLIALSPVGIETLTEIVEPAEVEHLLGLCRRGQSGSSTVAFRQALAQLGTDQAEGGFVGVPTRSPRGAR